MDNILNKIKTYYESASSHPTYVRWQASAKEAWAFYDGRQWTDDETEKLQANGQPAIVINKIAAKVDNIAGSEIAGRTRIVYRSRSGDAAEEQTAFILMDFTENAACLDVVCHPMVHGRWASKRTLKQLYRSIFEVHGLEYIWAEPKNARAAKTCFQAGFQLLPDMEHDTPVMVLTRRNFANLIEHRKN